MNASVTPSSSSADIHLEVQSLLKKCPFCSEAILMDAKKCRYCGEFLDPQLKTSVSGRYQWNPSIAAALSLLVPGGGHIYRGKTVKGFLWLFLVAAGYSFYLLPGMILHGACISFASMGNPLEE